MKLPKIPIQYEELVDVTKLPFNGDKVLLHLEPNDMPPFDGSTKGEYGVSVLEGYFYADGEDSCWIVCIDDYFDLMLGVSPSHYTPMPEFEEVEG